MKKFIIGIIVIVALGAIGWYGWNTMGGNQSSSPEDLLARMGDQMADIDSVYFTSSISLEGKTGTDFIPTSDFLPTTDDEDMVKQGRLMIDMTGAFAGDDDTQRGMIDIALGYESDEKQGNVGLATRIIDDQTYIQVNALDIPVGDDMAPMMDTLKKVLVGQWIDTTMEMQEDEDTKDQETIQSEFKNLLKNLSLLKNVTYVDTENIRGVKTTHIRAQINEVDMKTLMLESQKLHADDENNTSDEDSTAYVDDLIDMLQGQDIDMWIGSRDALLYKIHVAGPIKDDEEGVDGTADVTLELYDYNKDVAVTKPEQAMTIEQLTGQIMGAMMFGMVGNMDVNMMNSMQDFDFSNLEN